MDELKALLTYAARNSPSFRGKLGHAGIRTVHSAKDFAELVPLTLPEELGEAEEAYPGQRGSRRQPELLIQLESSAGAPRYVSLRPRELAKYAQVLTSCWRVLGIREGDRVAIFDYGASPLSYLASSLYTPYLKVGAADALGCITICNDGLPEMSGRALEILNNVHPRVLFIRTDCLQPFVQETGRQGMDAARDLALLVAEADEQVIGEETAHSVGARLGLKVPRVVRSDQAMFLAAECLGCGAFHTPKWAYHLEVVDEFHLKVLPPKQEGVLVITNLFARTTPIVRYVSGIRATMETGNCPWEGEQWRLRLW